MYIDLFSVPNGVHKIRVTDSGKFASKQNGTVDFMGVFCFFIYLFCGSILFGKFKARLCFFEAENPIARLGSASFFAQTADSGGL